MLILAKAWLRDTSADRKFMSVSLGLSSFAIDLTGKSPAEDVEGRIDLISPWGRREGGGRELIGKPRGAESCRASQKVDNLEEGPGRGGGECGTSAAIRIQQRRGFFYPGRGTKSPARRYREGRCGQEC
jgi:hypothetical protein